MSEKKYDAKLEQVKGNLKKGFGKVTGDKELETEGLAEKTIAKGKEFDYKFNLTKKRLKDTFCFI